MIWCGEWEYFIYLFIYVRRRKKRIGNGGNEFQNRNLGEAKKQLLKLLHLPPPPLPPPPQPSLEFIQKQRPRSVCLLASFLPSFLPCWVVGCAGATAPSVDGFLSLLSDLGNQSLTKGSKAEATELDDFEALSSSLRAHPQILCFFFSTPPLFFPSLPFPLLSFVLFFSYLNLYILCTLGFECMVWSLG